LIWRLGRLEDPRFLAWLVIGLSLAWFAVKGAKEMGAIDNDISAAWKNLPRHLGIMFWGAYFRIVYDETKGFRDSIRRHQKVWTLAGLTLVILAVGGARQFRFLIHPTHNWFSPYVVAPIIFCLWVVWLRVRNPALSWLGRISYSIYLFHHVVMIPVAAWVAGNNGAAFRGWPVVCYLIFTLIITIAVSAAVYYTVELPAIQLGKRLAGRRAIDLGTQAAP
jgi:peptidoglycan/LPS O-acetylase OafA/YrhL